MSDAKEKIHILVLYDGVCALCNGMVRFALRRDRNDAFRFAPLQSELANKILQRHGMKPGEMNTVCVVAEYEFATERVLTKSSAVLYIVKQMEGVWRLASVGRWIPRAVRDFAYDLIARWRYCIFGKYPVCPIPAETDRKKFLSWSQAMPAAAICLRNATHRHES